MAVFLSMETPYEPLKYQAIGNAILRVSKTAKVPFGAHDGRRIVETALENVGTPRNWIQKIKGRKVRGEDSPYSKPAIEQLRKKYREALPELEFLQQPTARPASTLSKNAVSFFEKFNQVLETHPDKMEKFEKFILDL